MSAQSLSPRGRIDAIVERVAAANGARVVRDVLLDLTVTTAAYSYILIDQYGLLILDVETWPGAEVRGGSGKKTWRAHWRGAPRQSFGNPLTENARRIDVLLQALLAFGRRIPRDYVSDMVVFVDADIQRLSLTDAEHARTVDSAGLEGALRARYDFAINYGAIDREEIEGLVSVLSTINRFDRAESEALRGTPTKPRAHTRLPWSKPAVDVGLADAAVGIAPVAPRLAENRYPGVAPPPRKPVVTGGLVALLAVVALAVWLFLFGGYALVTQRVMDSVRPNPPVAAPSDVGVPVMAPQPATTSVELAKSRLLEMAPQIYATIRNPDAPEIMVTGDLTTFTWQYIAKVSNSAAQVRSIAITIGSDGRVVGLVSSK